MRVHAHFLHFLRRAILAHKVDHSDLVFGVQSGSVVGLCMQDYKSLCAAVTICATMVNIQTHIHTQTAFEQLI